tara:strand:- start:73 stop:1038 length:966 start_codon:yes stop_codon:yes gene_type:complete
MSHSGKQRETKRLVPTNSEEHRSKNKLLKSHADMITNRSELRNVQHGHDSSPPNSSKDRYFYISLHGLSVRSSNVKALNNNVSYIVSSDHGVQTICDIEVEKNIVEYFKRNGHKKVKELFNGGLNTFVNKLEINRHVSKLYHRDMLGNEGQLHFTYRKLLYDIEFDFEKMYLNDPEEGGIFEIDENGISTGFTGWRADNITSYILKKATDKGKPRMFSGLKLSEIIDYLREKPGYKTQKYHFLIIACRSTDGDIGLERTWTERETICDKLGNCFKYIIGRKNTKHKKTHKKKKNKKKNKKKKKQYKKKKHTKKNIKTLKRK